MVRCCRVCDGGGLRAGPNVGVSAMSAFIPRLLSMVHVEMLVHGNATATEVSSVAGRTWGWWLNGAWNLKLKHMHGCGGYHTGAQ